MGHAIASQRYDKRGVYVDDVPGLFENGLPTRCDCCEPSRRMVFVKGVMDGCYCPTTRCAYKRVSYNPEIIVACLFLGEIR